jgi:hypothetical protein
MTSNDMKRYQSSEWNFALDVPSRWHSFPPVPTNSPHEVIRFGSREDGTHLLIIYRQPHDPKESLTDLSNRVQQVLAGAGFGNFATAVTTIQSK